MFQLQIWYIFIFNIFNNYFVGVYTEYSMPNIFALLKNNTYPYFSYGFYNWLIFLL